MTPIVTIAPTPRAKRRATEAAAYGRDTWCQDSLRSGRYASGLTLLAQRCYHRLTTPRGTLRGGEDEADFGIDLAGMIGAGTDPAAIAALPGKIRNELKKEAQIATVAVEVASATDSAGAVTLTITVTCTSALGPFELVVAVSAVTVELLKLEAA